MDAFQVELDNLESVGKTMLPDAAAMFGEAKYEIDGGAPGLNGRPLSGELYTGAGGKVAQIRGQFCDIFGDVEAELALAGEAIMEIHGRYRVADQHSYSDTLTG